MRRKTQERSGFWQQLKKRALTDDLINDLQESGSMDPFLTRPNQHSMHQINCATSHTKRALTNAVNRILQTDYHSALYLHSEKKWRKFCRGNERYGPFIRCGPIRKWQLRNTEKPITLSEITHEMTRDVKKQDTESRVFGLCKKHVRNVFNTHLWKSIRGSSNIYFSRLFPHSKTAVRDGCQKIGTFVLRCLLFAAIGEEDAFRKYKPMLFALRYGIPIEPHPHQPRYLTFLTR
jgi:hypothetical protein